MNTSQLLYIELARKGNINVYSILERSYSAKIINSEKFKMEILVQVNQRIAFLLKVLSVNATIA